MKLKTTMVISGARFLFYDLLNHYQFSDEDENRIIRCAADLENCVKESDENVTQENLRNIDDMQAEINRLRDDNYELKKIIIQLVNDVEFGEFVNLEAAKKALNDESEEKND